MSRRRRRLNFRRAAAMLPLVCALILTGTAVDQCPPPGNSGSHHRSYPCGKPDHNNLDTWEYTVTVPAKSPGRHGTVFIICGHKKASRYKAAHPEATVVRTAP